LIKITCGDGFSFAICSNFNSFNVQEYNVYSWGNNNSGQLGHGDTKERIIPTQVDFFDGKNILQIGCGDNHCLALEGNLISFDNFKIMETFIHGEIINLDNSEMELKLTK
jgi:alpha-tubulin suppressor-like RCC1 family protein